MEFTCHAPPSLLEKCEIKLDICLSRLWYAIHALSGCTWIFYGICAVSDSKWNRAPNGYSGWYLRCSELKWHITVLAPVACMQQFEHYMVNLDNICEVPAENERL